MTVLPDVLLQEAERPILLGYLVHARTFITTIGPPMDTTIQDFKLLETRS